MGSVLEHRVAVVTGGGRGFGAAIAEALAASGAHIAVLARSGDQVAQVAHHLTATGHRAFAAACDVSDPESTRQALAAVEEALGPIDILINNAAVLRGVGPTVEVDLAAWHNSVAINLGGAMTCINLVLPGMLERRWGRIINISSGAASGTGMQFANAYSVSKAGLEMLTLNLAAELAGSGVSVHAVRPGIMDTAMPASIRDADPALVGQAMYDRFQGFFARGDPRDPRISARLVARLTEEDTTGEIVPIKSERAQALLAAR